MTTYSIFMHYYNTDINKAVTNVTECEWLPADTANTRQLTVEDKDATTSGNNKAFKTEDATIRLVEDYINDQYDGKQYNELREKDEQALEYLYISPSTTVGSEDTNIYEKLMISGLSVNNPKYDMVFMWDGLGYITNEYYKEMTYNSSNNNKTKYFEDQASTATLYYDKMKRIQFLPWFFHSTYHSLQAAMNRASQLVNVYGKEHIMIGKEVDLTQYIDIV